MPVFTTTYAPGSQVKSADLNSLIAGKHDDRVLPVSMIGAIYTANGSFDTTNKYAINSGATQVLKAIEGLIVGDRIKSIDFAHYGNAAAYISVFTLNKMDASGVVTSVQSSGSVSTPAGAAWSTYTLTVAAPVAIVAGEVWWIEWLPNAVVQRLQGVAVTFDHP